MAKHWTQTPAGKKKMSEVQKARWALSRNGAAPELDELQIMQQMLELYSKLPQSGRNYIRQRIA